MRHILGKQLSLLVAFHSKLLCFRTENCKNDHFEQFEIAENKKKAGVLYPPIRYIIISLFKVACIFISISLNIFRIFENRKTSSLSFFNLTNLLIYHEVWCNSWIFVCPDVISFQNTNFSSMKQRFFDCAIRSLRLDGSWFY